MFGVHLGVETHDLDEINTRFQASQGGMVCLTKVYDKYKASHGPPSWEIIAEALTKMDKITLTDEIKKKYLVDAMSTEESGSITEEPCDGDNKDEEEGSLIKK